MGVLRRLYFQKYIFNGFTKEIASLWVNKKKKYRKIYSDDYDIIKKYLWCYPMMGKYNKLVDNRLAIRYELNEFREYLLKYYAQIIYRNGEKNIIPLHDNENKVTDILILLKEKTALFVMPSLDIYSDDISLLEWRNGQYYIDGILSDEKNLKNFIEKIEDTYIITEGLPPFIHSENNTLKKITVIVSNDNGCNPQILLAYEEKDYSINCCSDIIINKKNTVSLIDNNGMTENGVEIIHWELITDVLKKIMLHINELNFVGFEVVQSDAGFKILVMRSCPTLCAGINKIPAFVEFVKKKAEEKKDGLSFKRKVFLLAKNVYSNIAQRCGYMGFMMKNWQRDLIDDWKYKGTSFKQKLWSHKKGFLSFRIAQYNLNNKNYRDFLPDREYRKLRPINNEFLYWVYDKVTTRYILSEKKDILPEYFFHIVKRNNTTVILRSLDAPGKGEASFDDIFNLLKEKKKLALKPSEGSHGEGFAKIEYREDSFYINDHYVSQEDLKLYFQSLKTAFNITEYIENNDFFKEIYSGTTYTVRLMVINKHGNDPWIANAYLRIATDKTGATDNIYSGGLCTRIDLDTGEIYQPEKIENHVITPCLFHPDTHKKIEGKIPNWEYVKEKARDISRYIFQLEYMGFDVVITNDGMKLLEINTHQDLHRYPFYDKKIHQYFVDKLNMKKL